MKECSYFYNTDSLTASTNENVNYLLEPIIIIAVADPQLSTLHSALSTKKAKPSKIPNSAFKKLLFFYRVNRILFKS